MDVALDVLGILAIIVFGSFVIVLVADLLISIFDKHEGVFFNKKKKSKSVKKKDELVVYTGENAGKAVGKIEKADENKSQEQSKEVSTLDALGIKEQPNKTLNDIVITPVDMKKAEEEEKILRQKFAEVNVVDDFDPFDKIEAPESSFRKEEIIRQPIFEKEDSLENVLPQILKQALKETGAQTKNPKLDVFSAFEEPIIGDLPKPEPVKVVPQPEPEIAKAKIIYKTKPEVKKVSELEEVKKDLFKMKKSAILTKHSKKNQDQDEVEEANENKVDATELKKQKLAFATEKIKLIQREANQNKKNKQLVEEKEKLQQEVESLKRDLGKSKKPYYTQDYYQKRLAKLEKDLKEAKKELRLNKKEYVPLKKIKKAYEKDSAKLAKQEELVAKNKISLYGAGVTKKATPEKKAKLQEEVDLLNSLKENVYNCKQVLSKNKDKYVVLERTNKILVQTVLNTEAEIEGIKEALKWYEKN